MIVIIVLCIIEILLSMGLGSFLIAYLMQYNKSILTWEKRFAIGIIATCEIAFVLSTTILFYIAS